MQGWEYVVMLFGGVVCLVLGVYLRFAPPSERVRRTYGAYRKMSAPRYIRNSLLVLIPAWSSRAPPRSGRYAPRHPRAVG